MSRKTPVFEVTEDHLKLISEMYVEWWDCEYGAPCIDPKRPYGNSDVEHDVCRKLGWKEDDEGEYSRSILKLAGVIHKETEVALQICLSRMEFRTGVFMSDDICRREWAPLEGAKLKKKNPKVEVG